jgi:hypothetical protein
MSKSRRTPARRRAADDARASTSTAFHLTTFALGQVGRWLGAIWATLACGFLVLVWQLASQWSLMSDLLGSATSEVSATLVDRYLRLEPRYADNDPGSGCGGPCLIDLQSVAVVAYTDASGKALTREFVSTLSEPRDDSDFERALPMQRPLVRIAPEFLRFLRSAPSIPQPDTSLWTQWMEEHDDIAMWLTRRRDPVQEVMVPLRVDPDDADNVILDLPAQAQEREAHLRRIGELAVGTLFFALVIVVAVLYPSIRLLLPSSSRRVHGITTLVVVLTVPLWAPVGVLIASTLSNDAGGIAKTLQRDFAPDLSADWIGAPVRDVSALSTHEWTLAHARERMFLDGLSIPASGREPGANPAAYDELRQALSDQLAALEPATRLAFIERLTHYQAHGALELLAPALNARMTDPAVDTAEREAARRVLAYFVGQWRVPDSDEFLAAHRRGRFSQVASGDAELARVAASRLTR